MCNQHYTKVREPVGPFTALPSDFMKTKKIKAADKIDGEGIRQPETESRVTDL